MTVGEVTWVDGERFARPEIVLARIKGYDPASGQIKVRQAGTFEMKRAASAHVRSLLDPQLGTDREARGKFRFRLNAGGGEIIASSEAYNSKAAAQNGTSRRRRTRLTP